MRTTILRPGLLVHINSHVEAGVTYTRTPVEPSPEIVAAAEARNETATVTEWITTKIVPDREERDRAEKARTRACKEIYDLCARSRYAYICPLEREADLAVAEERARQIVDAHNASSMGLTRIDFYPSAWVLADKNEATIRKIGQEMIGLLSDMSRGIDEANPELIRQALTAANDMSSMLGEEQVKAVSDAVEQARKAARDITRRVGKKGEDVALVVKEVQRSAIEKARFAFLDLDDAAGETTEPSPDVQRFADLDVTEPAVTEHAPASPESPESEPPPPAVESGETEPGTETEPETLAAAPEGAA